MKKYLWATAAVLTFSTNPIAAEIFICKVEEKYEHGKINQYWPDENFILIDTEKSFAKMGTDEKWVGIYKLSSKKIAIGTKHTWSAELIYKDGREAKIIMSLRIHTDGKKELSMGSRFEQIIKSKCISQ